MKQKLLFIFVIAVLLLAACGTGGEPAPTDAPGSAATEEPVAEKKVATVSFTQEFNSLNPLYESGWFTTNTQQLISCWAWQFNDANEAYPLLVTELPSSDNGGINADGTQITIHLRDDIKWSDGEPITSEDFKFTWEMTLNPSNIVNSTYPTDQITAIDTPDAQTVVMTFDAPFVAWKSLWRGLIPSHTLKPIFDAEGTLDNAAWNNAPTESCGPYLFGEWESGSFASFVRNDNYFGEPAKIDEIFIRFVPDDASQTAALLAGDTDIGAFIPLSDVPKLKEGGVSIIVEPSGYNEGWFFQVNEEKSHPAMLDVNVRKAIAMSINRDAFNNDVLLGLTKTPGSFWDSLPYYNNPPIVNYPFDPEGAKALLDAAGWVDSNGDGTRDKDGVEFVIQHGATTREIRQDLQAVAQQQLAEVGIKLEIFNYESDIFFAGYADDGPTYSGELDIQEWSDAPSGFPDPDIYYWLCSQVPSDENPDGANSFYLCDEEMDALIQLQATQLDSVERQKTISQINQIFHDKVYWLGMWQDPDFWAVSARLTGVKFSGVSPFYNIAEWDIK
ncbi:MAG TPA: peptide ABC transporter substrate-binding protein [Anaerolineales bacterium]|nr:peptide ABC transporter substrate-binding protein [Anaerolineales bacterium]